jgi:hypothetical protein
MPKKVMGAGTPSEIVVPEAADPNAPEIPDEPVEVPEPTEPEVPIEEENSSDPYADDDLTPTQPVSLETADPNEILWEGGPTVGQALAWKQEYKKIYVTSLSLEDHVLWHTLKRGPYSDIMEQVGELNDSGQFSSAKVSIIQEELITKACMLHPVVETFEDELAGLPSLLSQQILEASGFVALGTRGL